MKDYKNYDTLTLFVKKKKLGEVIEHYTVFGWKLIEQKDNSRY